MNDLFQVGCIGLIKAVNNFDLSYGVMFSTYAVPLILGEVKRLVRSTNPLRVTRSIRDLALKILKYKEMYAMVNGFEPTNDAIAKELDVKEYEIREALESLNEPASIYEPVYSDGGDTIYLLDQIADVKTRVQDRDMMLSMDAAFKKIKSREKEILIKRYLIGKTQNEIAEDMNVSQAQVSRLEKSAIKTLKKLMN